MRDPLTAILLSLINSPQGKVRWVTAELLGLNLGTECYDLVKRDACFTQQE